MRARRCSRFLFFNTVVGGLRLGGLSSIDVSPPCRSSSRWLRTLRHISAEIHHSPLATPVRGFNVCDDMVHRRGDDSRSDSCLPTESAKYSAGVHFTSTVGAFRLSRGKTHP